MDKISFIFFISEHDILNQTFLIIIVIKERPQFIKNQRIKIGKSSFKSNWLLGMGKNVNKDNIMILLDGIGLKVYMRDHW